MIETIEKLKSALKRTRIELQEVWYNNRQSILCRNLLRIERDLEYALKSLGVKGYKRPSLKGVKK